MNRQETRALLDMGRDAWNEWSAQILKSKANFEDAGALQLNWYGEGENDETRLWLKVAVADFANEHFEEEFDLSGFVFPGPVNFSGTVFERPVSFAGADFQLAAKFAQVQFRNDASFKGAKFGGQAIFDDAAFEGTADFDRAEFLKEKNGPLTHGVRFQRVRFGGKTDFRSAIFAGSSDFSKAQFPGAARFDGARFAEDAIFESAVFSQAAGFNACQFVGAANFAETQFTSEGRFSEAVFKGPFSLARAQFWAGVSFRQAMFEKEATFADMRAEGACRFRAAKFGGDAAFVDARFSGPADFAEVDFTGKTNFSLSAFNDTVSWNACNFMDDADFSGVQAARSVNFQKSRFEGVALFREARFEGPVSFANASFDKIADFSAIQSKVAFVLADARLRNVPSLLDASFHEPPRVDNLRVVDPLKRLHKWKAAGVSDPRPVVMRLMKVCADPDASAKFRRLKKLAHEAQDHTREQEYFAQELRCRRFWHDRPFGRGVARFWLGWFYGGLANYGRSILRPMIVWLVSVFFFALYYLSQRSGFDTAVASNGAKSAANFDWGWLLGAKSACAASQSSPAGEALYLSFRSALLRLDVEDAATAKRLYGCLFGLDPSGAPLLPLGVSAVSLFQSVISAALIFLFLVALRNLLKVR